MAADSNLVQAIYTFKGKNNDELCFKKGDIITVSQREEGGWWEGTLGETTGWFPSNYVKEYKDLPGSAATSPVRAPSEIQAFRNVVLKDIIDSEKAHVAELQGLVTNFLLPLEKSDIVTRDEYKQLTGNILEVLRTHEELVALVEECGTESGSDQRVGGLFLQWAPKIKAVHQSYCASHPRAVCILDKYKEELNAFMERCGAVCPGLLVLTTGLSKPFRRLHKYAAMLQELGRHVLESHPDRGDTHRAVAVYKDIASTCAGTRRQKELELQVVTGAVRGWRGGDLASLGEVLHMGGVALGDTHADRYLVLFPAELLILSVSRRMSAFVYEGSLHLSGIQVLKLDDNETRKNAFEISGPLIETIVAVCQSNADAQKWVSLLQQHSNSEHTVLTGRSQPQSPSHDSVCSSSRGSLTFPKVRNPRDSLYHVTMPPSTYPSASPYAALSKYFAKLVRLRIITRAILKKLLYTQPGVPPDMSMVKFRHRHTSQVKLRINEHGGLESDDSDSDSDDESESSVSGKEYYLSEPEASGNGKIARQDAIDLGSQKSISSAEGTRKSNPFGYIRYFNNPSETNECGKSDNAPADIRIVDCTHEIFMGIDQIKEQFSPDVNDNPCPVIRIVQDVSADGADSNSLRTPLAFINQYSEGSDNSSFDTNSKPYMACEDLVNLDQNLAMESIGYEQFSHINLRQSCPTKFVADRFNDSSLTSVCTPGWQSCSVNSLAAPDAVSPNKSGSNAFKKALSRDPTSIENESGSKVPVNVLLNLEPPSPSLHALSASESTCSDISQETIIGILEPPPMFKNENSDIDLVVATQRKYSFERHSIDSDKKIRKSSLKCMEVTQLKEHSVPLVDSLNMTSELRNCVSCPYMNAADADFDRGETNCDCCNRSRCHSPRSSDSGVAGSCNLASPENHNRVHSLYTPSETQSLHGASFSQNLYNDYSMSTGEISKLNYMRNKLTLSEAEAAKFEDQCPCTSPFSTPRTSCQPSTTSENMTTGNLDPARTSVTSSFMDSIPYPPKSSKSIQQLKANAETGQTGDGCQNEKPLLYRKPSKQNPNPRNVRHAAVNHGHSTPDISVLNKTKPSKHYHMRIYQESTVLEENQRQSVRPSRNTESHREEVHSENVTMRKKSRDLTQDERRARSKSEDLAKKYYTKNANPGHAVYRSDLYAHWWMKAKLPITVTTSVEYDPDHGFIYLLSLAEPFDGNRQASSDGAFFKYAEDSGVKNMSTETPVNSAGGGTATNHKRSHSFNNHLSYTQLSQQYQFNRQQQRQQQSDSSIWQQKSSCDAPSGPSRLTSTSSIPPNITAFEFAERFNMNRKFEGWNVKNLRPAAPLRPLPSNVFGGSDEGTGPAHPYSPIQRKANSYEEDGLILRVIEAYCTSVRSRNTVNSDFEDESMGQTDKWLVRSPSLPLHNAARGHPSPWSIIFQLREDVRSLKEESKLLHARLDEERQERTLSIAAMQPNSAILRNAKESNC